MVISFSAQLFDFPAGPKCLEYNCRLGDPETQVLLPLLETDLYLVLKACVERCLDSINVVFSSKTAATVVIASAGYPGDYPKVMMPGIESICVSATVDDLDSAMNSNNNALVAQIVLLIVRDCTDLIC